jgi:hypothetical protein
MGKMIYSDAENKRWWDGMPKHDQAKLLQTILDKATTPGVKDWAELLIHVHQQGGALTPKNLASIRKWSK